MSLSPRNGDIPVSLEGEREEGGEEGRRGRRGRRGRGGEGEKEGGGRGSIREEGKEKQEIKKEDEK